jgi:hypothetical protein
MKRPATWQPPYDFAAAMPTFVGAWPREWHDLAPDTEIVQLNRNEINALGSQIAGFRHWFTSTPVASLLDLAYRLDAAIERQGRSSFIRLSSRSPKDSLYAQRKGMRISDGAKALALIIEGSQRCAADLRMALDRNATIAIVVRRWIDFPWWAEFRCFMVDYRWVGASQVRPPEGPQSASIAEDLRQMLVALQMSMHRIISTSLVPSAAFDLICLRSSKAFPRSYCALLLDVNPLWDVTDLALFSSTTDFDLTFRFLKPHDQTLGAIPLSASPIAETG